MITMSTVFTLAGVGAGCAVVEHTLNAMGAKNWAMAFKIITSVATGVFTLDIVNDAIHYVGKMFL